MMMEDTKPENSQTYKLWQYCLDICEYMYNEGLIDRQEFLQSVLEMVERCRDPNDPILRILMPVILQVRIIRYKLIWLRPRYYSPKTIKILKLKQNPYFSIPRSLRTLKRFLVS